MSLHTTCLKWGDFTYNEELGSGLRGSIKTEIGYSCSSRASKGKPRQTENAYSIVFTNNELQIMTKMLLKIEAIHLLNLHHQDYSGWVLKSNIDKQLKIKRS